MTEPILDISPTSGILKALADDTRLRIVALLSHGELCVCHLVAALEITQPNASQHLTVLRNAGVVEGRRKGSWIHYRIAPQPEPTRERIVAAVVQSFAELAPFIEDRRRLAAARTGVSCES